MKEISLPFNQNSSTARQFEFWKWCFCVNKARHPDQRQSGVVQKRGRFWVSHKRTRSVGIFTKILNNRNTYSFVHRVTAAIRKKRGVKYLQLIFFSWWVGVVRKDVARFIVN